MKTEPCILCNKMTNSKALFYGKLIPICDQCLASEDFEKCYICNTYAYVSDLYVTEEGWQCKNCGRFKISSA